MTSLLLISSFLAQETEYEAPKGPGPVFWICEIAFIILMVAAMWKVFSKAGQPGWAAIIPIVNMYFLCKVAGRPGWWVILLLIPLVNLIIFIILSIDVPKALGKLLPLTRYFARRNGAIDEPDFFRARRID